MTKQVARQAEFYLVGFGAPFLVCFGFFVLWINEWIVAALGHALRGDLFFTLPLLGLYFGGGIAVLPLINIVQSIYLSLNKRFDKMQKIVLIFNAVWITVWAIYLLQTFHI